MENLKNVKWGASTLSDLFTFERGKEKNMAALPCGDVALVSARNVNNGIKGFVGHPAKIIKGGNVMTLNNDGDGGAGLAYYQSIDFALDTHVTALHPKDDVNPEILLYMSASISKQHEIFGHGRSISLPRAHRIQCIFPVTPSGKPDYNYMMEYVQRQRAALLEKYKAYVKQRIAELGNFVNTLSLNEKAWQSFQVKDIADVYSGHDIYVQERMEGSTPLVTAVGSNNGIGYFVGNENDSRDTGAISVVRNGASVGKAFYHKYSALYGNDCRRIKLKNTDSEFVNLFISQMIGMQSRAFSYSRKLGTERLLNLRIMLPVDEEGTPDYPYMEQYVKNMMLRKYRQYLAYLDSKKSIK